MSTVQKIKTAVIPAAGSGIRLRPLTNTVPKCMVEVNGRPMLEYTIEALENAGFEELILVTGYKSEVIEDFVKSHNSTLDIKVIYNDKYDTTNNIYSIYLTENYLRAGFTIIESDLIFDPELLELFTLPNRAALEIYNPEIHNGTRMTVTDSGIVEDIFIGATTADSDQVFKTVNIYSLSDRAGKSFLDEIRAYIERGETDVFYECAFRQLMKNEHFSFEMIDFTEKMWFEIDTLDDLKIAEQNLELIYQ